MALGLGASLNTVRKTTLSGMVTSGLVLKQNFDTGAVTPISDGAAYFNQSNDDYIALSSITAISGDFTVAAWIAPDTLGYDAILGSSGSIKSLIGFAGADDIRIRLHKADDSSYWYDSWDTGLADIATDGTWTHYAVTKSGTTLLPYINGVLGATGTLNGSDGILKIDTIGGLTTASTPAYEWDGLMCNIGIFSAVLTQAQVKSIMYKDYSGLTTSEKTNLVSWWNLSALHADGSTVVDSHGSNNGTLS